LSMSKFSEDIARYRSMGHKGKQLWLDPAVWAITIYRFGNWLYTTNPFILVRIPLKIVYFFAYKFSELVMEMCLDPQATIGGGLYIMYKKMGPPDRGSDDGAGVPSPLFAETATSPTQVRSRWSRPPAGRKGFRRPGHTPKEPADAKCVRQRACPTSPHPPACARDSLSR